MSSTLMVIHEENKKMTCGMPSVNPCFPEGKSTLLRIDKSLASKKM